MYALSETFPSYVPPERKMKMVYALKCPLAPDFGEITYEWCISLFGVVLLKLNKVNDNHKQTIWKNNYHDEFNPLPRYIPSTPQFICLLLTLYLTEGAHVAKKNEVTKKRNAVSDHFFQSEWNSSIESRVVQEGWPKVSSCTTSQVTILLSTGYLKCCAYDSR